ncbi:fimbrial protein [Burkholderia multivorans]|uniref:fimbrial protein n=1 Tax=Burkholderia multivorans TaxID=87883 RepID=UPI0020B37075|nr:fimbrial protein [Burkholderia multivorans]
MYRLFAGCLMVVWMAAPGGARAACEFVNNKSELIVNLAFKSEYHVPPGTAIGTVLDDVRVSTDSTSYALCGAPGQSNRSVYGGAQVGSGTTPYTFATNIPGIGLAFYDEYGRTRYWGEGNGGAYQGYWSWDGSRIGAKLIVTGPVGVGDVPGGSVYARMTLDGLPVATIKTTGFKITTPACSVPSVNVDMGSLTLDRFAGVASTAGDKPFDLRLTACPAGRTGIYYRFDPTTQVVPGTGNSVAALNGSSGATGIGLQLLDGNGKPVQFGQSTKMTGYTGAAGDYSVPFRARYYQTAATVTPGSANASITVTMSYQ